MLRPTNSDFVSPNARERRVRFGLLEDRKSRSTVDSPMPVSMGLVEAQSQVLGISPVQVNRFN